jgi:hypothetical protein
VSPASANANVDWHVQAGNGETSFRWGRVGDEIVAEWAGILRLRASSLGEPIEIEPAANAPSDLVEKLRRGTVEAFLRSLRGEHSLHASAVAIAETTLAIVCVGDSGSGKSTLAGHLAALEGVELLADDVAGLVTDDAGIHVIPSENAVWLVNGDGAPKRAVRTAAVAKGPSRLAVVLSLHFDDRLPAPDLRRLRGAESMHAVVSAMMRFEATEAIWQRELDVLTKLVGEAQIFSLTRPRCTTSSALATMVADQVVSSLTHARPSPTSLG